MGAPGDDGTARGNPAEATAADGAQLYRTVFTGAHDPIALVTLDPLRLVEANPAFCQAWGYRASELAGLDARALARDPDELHALLEPVLDGRSSARRLRWYRKRDGSLFPVEATALPIRVSGQPGAWLLLRDLSEVRRLQERLLRSDRLAALGSLAGGVAHEISGPLAVLISNLTFATETVLAFEAQGRPAGLSPELGVSLGDGLEAAQQLRALVADLKTFSRPEPPGSQPVDLKTVLESVLRLVQQELRHRARLEVDLGELPRVASREARLGQLFLQLLVLLMQGLPERPAPDNRVRVTGRARGGQVQIDLEDNGRAPSADERRLLLDPLFAPEGSPPGGLSLCRSLAEQLGGNVEYLAGAEGGNLIRVSLPVAAPQQRPVSDPTLIAVEPLPRVLLIDDEPLLLEAVRRMLAGEADLVTVGTPAEGLQRLLAGEPFAAVLCDLLMPDMTGMELFEKVSAARPEIAGRLGFITGGAFTPQAQEFLQAQAARVLEKPFSRNALRGLIRALIDGRFA